jgi:ABC-type multidrug transport system ATPase subunit
MSAAEPLVAADQLVFRYPEQDEPALCGVDVRLARAQAVGLLGPNGSGKSTLINLLVGLRKPQSGTIHFPAGRPAIAWVPQDYAFYPELTCRENLALFAGMLDLSAGVATERVDEAIATCMLHEFVDRRARHCSGGVRRRLNLGIALLPRPDVLLLDEPTVGVDPQSRAFLLERVRQFVDEGTAVLYATHYMEEVSAVCSHILVLDHGRVVASGSLETLLRESADGGPFANLEDMFMHHTQRRLRD